MNLLEQPLNALRDSRTGHGGQKPKAVKPGTGFSKAKFCKGRKRLHEATTDDQFGKHIPRF